MAIGQPSRDVRRANFGKFVARALDAARSRGLTIPQIEEATGVGKTTFYRWRNGDWTRDPRASEVRGFCEGLGVSIHSAHDALGWTNGRNEPEASPPIDPDVKIVLRRLADPSVSDAEKATIRATLRYLADLADRQPQVKRTARKRAS